MEDGGWSLGLGRSAGNDCCALMVIYLSLPTKTQKGRLASRRKSWSTWPTRTLPKNGVRVAVIRSESSTLHVTRCASPGGHIGKSRIQYCPSRRLIFDNQRSDGFSYRQTMNFNQPSHTSLHACATMFARTFPRHAARAPYRAPSTLITTTLRQP